jgi:hypothetical protein
MIFTAIGFPAGGSGQETCKKIGKTQQYTKGEIILKRIQKHRIHKIENQHKKQENEHKKNIKETHVE